MVVWEDGWLRGKGEFGLAWGYGKGYGEVHGGIDCLTFPHRTSILTIPLTVAHPRSAVLTEALALTPTLTLTTIRPPDPHRRTPRTSLR